ncbi:MAG: GNAT family N-acetyltransferase [Coriobacteriia bacterium]
MSAEPIFGPEPLNSKHELEGFDCGIGSLNDYLLRRASSDQRAGKSRTYVIARGRRVVGYFSIAASSIEPQNASQRAAKGQGAQAIPAVLIGRLAIDSSEKGQGLGEALLVEALRKSAVAAETIGVRVVLVDALDERAKGFYIKYGFEASPTEPHHLMLLMKDVRQTLRSAG